MKCDSDGAALDVNLNEIIGQNHKDVSACGSGAPMLSFQSPIALRNVDNVLTDIWYNDLQSRKNHS